MRIEDSTLMSAGDMSGNLTSSTIQLQHMGGFSIHAVSTGGGAPTGTVKLQCSNDGTNWDDIASQSSAITADINKVFNVTDAFYKYARCIWTRTSGTGTLVLKLYGKGF